jgi:chromosome segregation ATPase
VAETVEAASAAIAFLKKEMLGSTSFIVLEKIEYLRRNMGPFTAPEGVPRLYDLVKSKKPEYATAFYFALRDSLVAKDLEQVLSPPASLDNWFPSERAVVHTCTHRREGLPTDPHATES